MKIQIVLNKIKDQELVSLLSGSIKDIFKKDTVIIEQRLPLLGGFNPGRNQLNSTWVLKQLLNGFPDNCDKILGVVNHDLYIPIFTFVFGEAELNGRAAVISTHRFHNEYYGLAYDKEKFNDRVVKEAVHELGHTFGLKHCHSFDCVMRASNYVEEVDLKTRFFCDKCLNNLFGTEH